MRLAPKTRRTLLLGGSLLAVVLLCKAGLLLVDRPSPFGFLRGRDVAEVISGEEVGKIFGISRRKGDTGSDYYNYTFQANSDRFVESAKRELTRLGYEIMFDDDQEGQHYRALAYPG